MTNREATQTINLIRSLLPAFEEIIHDVRKGHGFFNFDARLVAFLSKGEASPWAVFYQDFNQIKALSLFSMEKLGDTHNLTT